MQQGDNNVARVQKPPDRMQIRLPQPIGRQSWKDGSDDGREHTDV